MKRLAVVAVFSALFLPGSAAAQKSPPAKPLDLNSATAAQLQQVPGIGPSTARAIVQLRRSAGPFRRLEDLLAIHGITKRRLAKMRPYVSVSPSSPAPARNP